MGQPNILLGWVKPSVFEQLKGVSASSLEGKRKAGNLIEGYHYKKAEDGKYYFHFERYDEYVEFGKYHRAN